MKKLFVAVALVMGIGTSVFAYNMNPASIETVTTVNDFTPIEVKDLPAAVQEAITKNYADLTIKEASVCYTVFCGQCPIRGLLCFCCFRFVEGLPGCASFLLPRRAG